MYEPDTILKLKDPRSTGTPDEDGYEPFAYDQVKVVGPSPINHGGIEGAEWVGTAGQGVIVEPLTSFGAILDEPFGKLQKLYDVESVPDRSVAMEMPVRTINAQTASAGATPEEVFATEAPGEASTDGKRVRTPHSPLDALVKQEDYTTSPLGRVRPEPSEDE